MNSSRINEIAYTELLDAPQTLYVRVLQYIKQQRVRNLDETEHGVVDYFLIFSQICVVLYCFYRPPVFRVGVDESVAAELPEERDEDEDDEREGEAVAPLREDDEASDEEREVR